MKLIVNLLVVLLGSSFLVGCDSEDASSVSTMESRLASIEGIEGVLKELEAFIETGERETITMTKEDAERILSILRPEPNSETAQPVIAISKGSDSKPPAPEIESKPVMSEAKSKEMAARSVAKKVTEVPEPKDKVAAKKEKPEAIAVSKETKQVKGASDKLPDSDVARPEGYSEKIVDPTTGSEFVWSSKKSVWISDAFGDYLKGSEKQNDSFCWLLTQNSSGVDKGAIPRGWVYLPLTDRKTVVIVEESRTPKIVATGGKLEAVPKSESVVKSEKVKSGSGSKPEEQSSGEMLTEATAEKVDSPSKPSVQQPVLDTVKNEESKAMPPVDVSSPSAPAKEEVKVAAATPPETKASPIAEDTPPASRPPAPAEEPARMRVVSEVLPIGATLPDGRRLVPLPQYETRRNMITEQPAARPVLRAVPARKVDAQVQNAPDKKSNVSGASDQSGVPTAQSKPVIRPTITIKSRRVGNLWKNKQEEQPVQPGQ